jgi:GT2 family glycosyltransferase
VSDSQTRVGDETRGDRPRIAVITLVQRSDFPSAWSSLRTLEGQLSSTRRRFLLVNDSPDSELMSSLDSLAHTSVSTHGHNIGVAAGRNDLLRRALDWGADLIVTLDDDLLVPIDYLDRVEEAMEMDAAPAIATPILLDYHQIAPLFQSPDEVMAVETGSTRDFEFPFESAVLMSLVKSLDEHARKEAVHHLGVRDWASHYFAPLGHTGRSVLRALNSVAKCQTVVSLDEKTYLGDDPATIESAFAGGDPMPIDCAPGGSMVYRAAVLDQLGLLEEAFSPFGYEDSEFCIRARRAGLNVAVLRSTALLHDLQSRHKTREPLVVGATRAKARALLIRLHSDGRSVATERALESLIIGSLETTSSPSGPIQSMLSWIAGVIVGTFSQLSTEPLGASGIGGGEPACLQVDGVVSTLRLSDTRGFLPRAFSGAATFSLPVRTAPHGPRLPKNLAGRMGASYHFENPDRLCLDRLSITVPGLLDVEVRGEIDGVSADGSATDPVESIVFRTLEMVVTDRGFVDAWENTRAWHGGWGSTGLLRTLASKTSGPSGIALRRFLAPGSARTLEVKIQPAEPVSVRDLTRIEGGTLQVARRLGLTVSCFDALGSASSA